MNFFLDKKHKSYGFVIRNGICCGIFWALTIRAFEQLKLRARMMDPSSYTMRGPRDEPQSLCLVSPNYIM